jgi:hypothetical protein
MKNFAISTLCTLLILSASRALAGELEDTLAKSAYRTQPALATQADASFTHAMEIAGSKFTAGTHKEFRAELNKAAILGHEDAAAELCMLNSHEMLGTFFFQTGYFWCRAARFYFTGKAPEKANDADKRLAYVTKRLGPEVYLGEEQEAFMLKKMLEAATPPKE